MIPSADAEIAVGIECYATKGPPCAGRAKSTDDDFVVEEQVVLDDVSPVDRPDYLPLYRVEKRSVDTIHMVDELSRALRSRVSFGGLKDKRAAAVQYVTPTSRRAARPAVVVGDKFKASLVGYVPRPLSKASVVGNRFCVVLRGCCPEIGARVEEAMGLAVERMVPNFFGLQRFGSSGAGTHLIGRALVRNEFETAVTLMLLAEDPHDPERGRAVREAVAAGRYGEGADLLPPGRDVERRVATELSRHPGEWIRALRAVPVKVRRLYVQAYQSWIFNRTLSRAVRSGEDISRLSAGDNWAPTSGQGLVTGAVRGVREAPSEGAVPMAQIVGYAYRDYGSRFDSIINEVLRSDEITPGKFYVKEMQEVSAEGGFRRPHLAVRDHSWSEAEGTATLRFILAKGQYATVLLREMVKPRDPAASGLA